MGGEGGVRQEAHKRTVEMIASPPLLLHTSGLMLMLLLLLLAQW
jgi:hypothetical protein